MRIHRQTAGIVAGAALLILATPSVAAGPAGVSVRVEAAVATLVPTTAVTTTTAAFTKTGDPNQTCSGTSAGGALELATSGDWGGSWHDDFGQQVERIRTVTHPIGADYEGRYWAFYLNDKPASEGACAAELQEGDEVLFYSACGGATTDCFSEPLDLVAPARVQPGAPFNVRVFEITTTFGGPPDFASTTTEGPSEGATVAGGGRQATTDAAGYASFTLTDRGQVTLVATKGDRVREGVTVCVTDGADGFCGTAKPGNPSPVAAPCTTTGDDGRCGTRDRRPPQARVTSITDGERFARGDAPRELKGTVAVDPSGLSQVKLRLTRRYRGRCWYFSGRREVFRRTRCGRGLPFKIGDRADWSYLLPAALGRGRYVLDVVAIDGAFNRDPLARGRNRIVFTVA